MATQTFSREGMALLETAVHTGYHTGWRRQTGSNSMVGPSILHGKEAKTQSRNNFMCYSEECWCCGCCGCCYWKVQSYTQNNRTRFVLLKDDYREDRFWISKLESRDNCRFQTPPPTSCTGSLSLSVELDQAQWSLDASDLDVGSKSTGGTQCQKRKTATCSSFLTTGNTNLSPTNLW